MGAEFETSEEKPFLGKKVYFSTSIKGVLNPDPHFAISIVTFLQTNGANVLSEHVAFTDPDERNSVFIKRSGINRNEIPDPWAMIREADLGWVDEAHYLIASVDTPSIGVGMEIQRALDKHKMGMNVTPVLCLLQEGRYEDLTNMIKGISSKDSPSAEVRVYVNSTHAKRIVKEFLLKY